MATLTILGIGLLFGLKHATEVDHVVAVSTIVTQQRNVLRSALVGALWGAGHTASLLLVGIVVLALRIAIPESVTNWFELGVALMIPFLALYLPTHDAKYIPGIVAGELATVLSLLVFSVSVYHELMRPRLA